jgi:NAD(P)-dependent dehydrogenase (short-subunit alcohol dehydrogenase family)
MSQLNGKAALVTGGSRGIGAAIARHLARGGADVAVTYISAPDKANSVVAEVESSGRRGIAIHADSAQPAAVTAAVEQTAARLGRLDILVNNAGIFVPASFDDTTLDEMERYWTINIRAAIVASHVALKYMGVGGRIINIGSCLAERVPGPGLTLYSMTKAALVGFTKGLARDLGPRGITVNNIEPGPIDTDMNPATGEGADYQRSLVATGQYGTPDDIAAMVAFLADDTGRNITGASFLVDGGFAA